jgi:hypothetical protein
MPALRRNVVAQTERNPMTEALVVREKESTAVAVTPMAMLQLAVEKGASVEQLKELMDLQERWEATEARKAFVTALNAFKADPPEVLKSTKVAFGNTRYNHASLDSASEIIGAALSKHDISHRWDVNQADGKIKVTCVLTHALGHSERVTMEAVPDNSGSKNSIQQVGSTVTYLQRYTLFAATGIAAKNEDDDGRGGAKVGSMDERVKADYIGKINALANLKEADVLWATIADECTKVGDVPAYDELKLAMAAKRKTFKKVAETTI